MGTIKIFLVVAGLMVVDVAIPSGASKSCMGVSPDDYVCVDEVFSARAELDGVSLIDTKEDRGAPQRVDGTAVEKDEIRQILHQMDDYYRNEVITHPQYATVRHTCKNSNELCAFWTSVNECESNRLFMMHNCALACRLCLLASITDTS